MPEFRAAVSRSAGQPYTIETVTGSDLRPDEVLVRVVAAGMCHTDMVAREPNSGLSLAPVILGHEGSGVVEAVGSSVIRVVPGDHVILSFDSCGKCSACLGGEPAYCAEFPLRNVSGRRPDGTGAVTDADGHGLAHRWFGQSSFAEYAWATERNVVVVPKDLPLELLGPLGCGLQTGAGAVLNEMKPWPGSRVAVFGAGAVGLAALMAAKVAGAGEIVAVDLKQSRLDVARELGATRTVLADDPDLVEAVRGGDGPEDGMDYAVDTTAVTSAISATIAVLRRRGEAVFLGVGRGMLEIAPGQLNGRKATFVNLGGGVPQVFVPRLIELWRHGRFPFDKLVRTYPLDDINTAEADSLSGATVKPVLLIG
ncbi:NAD(P)-dependent alcohol dehydrogenase [Nakamurella leprariae]|uniref:NAD(P)-dependent alcohol dehydrogenase n=1 Tax=Nakamurella leprariae TaxID=2803911 RepID=A0A938YHE5_9ACTN|nr:NAD(P)-dependent alcohol dehydrogenase [Nakamurella leprariae]MBM9468164.1 NAD(P)-dependent alcohol dehydrogenase [Nakamurella leprariae]